MPAPGLVNPPSVAWHPSGNYALVLNATNSVHRYDPVTHSLTSVGTTANNVTWRAITFSPDGSKAVLLGNVSSPVEGRVYVWDDATSQLTQMSTVTFAGGTYEGIEWSHDGATARLLGSKPNAGSYIAYLWKFDLTTGTSDLKAQATSAGCQDLGWATDAFGGPAVAVTCGVNGVSLFHLDASGFFQNYSMNAGNTSRIAARPQGDYALAIGWSGQRIYRFELGNWSTGFSNPTFPGIFQVAFSTDGARALVLGGYGGNPPVGQIYEFRDDLFQQADITDVSIPNFSLAPYNAISQDRLNDAAFRPGCDGGLIVGGSSTFSGSKAYVIRFSVDNGTACPN
ncbi:MAG: WD40 repeat domain-containing protein [Polyangiaceae bacterium]